MKLSGIAFYFKTKQFKYNKKTERVRFC